MLWQTGSIKIFNFLIILIITYLDQLTIQCDHLTLNSNLLRSGLGTGLSSHPTTTTSLHQSMTAVTVDDLARITKEQTELIMKLREDDKKERAAERAEDVATFSRMIGNTMDEKLDKAVKPLVVRQDTFEKETKEAISDMSAQLSAFNAKLASLQQPTSRESFASVAAGMPVVRQDQPATSDSDTLPRPDIVNKLEDIVATAKLTLGFAPIEKHDLLRVGRKENLISEQDIMKHAIIDFLRGEMNIRNINVSDIVKVFPQAGIPEQQCNRLYAQFKAQHNISTVYRHVSKLRTKEHRVVLYAPYTHQEQLRYLGDLAMKYRNPSGPGTDKYRTRMKYGLRDLYLQIKPLGSTMWTTVDTPNLPPIQTDTPPTQAVSLSPPLGRQRDEQQNKRAASASPPSQSKNKDARLVSGPGEEYDGCQELSTLSSDNKVAEDPEHGVVTDQGPDSICKPNFRDDGDFVNNQVFSPRTGAVTFSFTNNERRHSVHSLNC